ncbi:ankyrin repeat domain-containing protein [Paenibacillus sp. PL91]|uniref:ankyrin repeat domain-containing protein n=1 Tax=Paenibacillus sp. PL91 TaxID=2729538 RepID=UPI00145E1364|nr:ankyrin repeat domain-containing protein [Paenibacillus sp. PL91]MBC9201394.1 ankyrin repeat domain-containing protein [Paenibacillus sp. PL91]
MENKLAIQPELVRDFVGNAHGDLDRVKELLLQEPGLVNAAWDWGGGDWETAIGAAAHMGRRDIAQFLIENGARLDLFAAAMLGKIDIVRAMLADNANLVNARGAHGIPLVVHAQQGGEEAAQVLDLLNEYL